MKELKYSFTFDNHVVFLLSRIIGRIFHVTSYSNYKKIIKDGRVHHNRDIIHPLNEASGKSLGRLKGFVCLFDFRNKTRVIIDEARVMYDFCNPNWFSHWDGTKKTWHLAYLILKQDYENIIIPNNFAREHQKDTGEYLQYVPIVECWHPGDLPIEYIEYSLLLKVTEHIPKDSLEYTLLSSNLHNKIRII